MLSSKRACLAALASALWAQQPQPIIQPQASSLLSGGTRTFRVSSAGPGAIPRKPEAWVWTIQEGGVGAFDGQTSVYTAPPVADPCLVKILATCRNNPGLRAEAVLLVLPHQPFDTIAKVLGPSWLEPLSASLPFLNVVTGTRYGETAKVVPWDLSWQAPLPVHYVGVGIPFGLRWQAKPQAIAQLLTLGTGPHANRLQIEPDGSRLKGIALHSFVQNYTVEALRPVPDAAGLWLSDIRTGSFHVRGVGHHAGSELHEPRHRDGSGASARFLAPFGLARVRLRQDVYRTDSGYLVTDPASQVIRLAGLGGALTTPWGVPGQAGHRDNQPSLCRRMAAAVGLEQCFFDPSRPAALFNGPTFLCARPHPSLSGRERGWKSCLVADSGNQVIRELYPDGATTTLAGVPGRAGHRDGWAGQALFQNPQGLAEDPAGNVYIADQGNRVIRRHTARGEVVTLAGSPGQAGVQDGLGAQARFTELRGLALLEEPGQPLALFAADGHALRRISLPDGQVTTVLGMVAVPGFRDIQGGDQDTRRHALRQACLNQPCGLLWQDHHLAIADQGNHSVRIWSPRKATLATLVGDPELGRIRWGLPRDGLTVPLDDRFAALEAPRTLAPGLGNGEVLVASGCCLARISSAYELRDRLGELELDCPDAEATETCVVRFQVEALTSLDEPTLRHLHYSVDFVEADGTLSERREGISATSTPTAVQGAFGQRGQGTVVVRCVTDQGVSVGAQRRIEVR